MQVLSRHAKLPYGGYANPERVHTYGDWIGVDTDPEGSRKSSAASIEIPQYLADVKDWEVVVEPDQHILNRFVSIWIPQITNPPNLVSKYSIIPSRAPSRPNPLSFIPPKGAAALVGLISLIPIIPKFNPSKVRMAVDKF